LRSADLFRPFLFFEKGLAGKGECSYFYEREKKILPMASFSLSVGIEEEDA